ncbi:MAG: MerR family transcriptional regulator [Clostridium sp.]|uniref:MerR family transcriptional regulator n=1 Tax=Clostridium sp. TaxID=1506 RepID=UPI003D6D26E5
MDTTYYKIEEVAVKTGLTKRTLRYYEDIELITPKRTECSYRLYSQEDIDNINRIKDLRESLGFCLKDVKVIIELGNDVKQIYNQDVKDVFLIEKSMKEIKLQITLLEEKQLSLTNSKEKFKIALEKLEEIRNLK